MFLTCLSYFSRYFHILVFLRDHYLLISLRPFLGCTGIRFLILFLVPLALRGSTLYMRPHISGTEHVGFSKQDAFRLLPKVSGAKVHWANANHTFLTHKNPQIDTFSHVISPAKLRSTTRVWNPQGISILVKKVDCRVPCASLKAIVQAFLATKPFTAGSSTFSCHMACISKSVPRDVISLSNYWGFMCIK
jgi:hypothetical protein